MTGHDPTSCAACTQVDLEAAGEAKRLAARALADRAREIADRVAEAPAEGVVDLERYRARRSLRAAEANVAAGP